MVYIASYTCLYKLHAAAVLCKACVESCCIPVEIHVCNEETGWKSIAAHLTIHLNGGPLLAAKTGPTGPILAAKSGPGGPLLGGTDFGVTVQLYP